MLVAFIEAGYWERVGQKLIWVTENIIVPVKALSIDALVGAVALVVAVYIPLAILLMDNSSKVWSWDRLVLVEKVLNMPRLLYALILSVTALIFWGLDAPWLPDGSHTLALWLQFMWDVTPIVFYMTGLVLMFMSMVSAYFWLATADNPKLVRGNNSHKSHKRLEYLDGLPIGGKEIAYLEIWDPDKADDIGKIVDEKGIALKFLGHLESLCGDDEVGSNVVRRFTHYLNKSGGIFLDDVEVYNKMFELALCLTAALDNAEQQKTRRDPFLDAAIRQFFSEIVHCSVIPGVLLDKQVRAFRANLFFSASNKAMDDKTENERHALMEDISRRTLGRVFDRNSRGELDPETILAELPDDWRVSVGSLGVPGSMARIWLRAYISWSLGFISRSVDPEHEWVFDRVTEQVVHRVDRELWANLLVFSAGPVSSRKSDKSEEESRVRNFIEFADVPVTTSSGFAVLGDFADLDKANKGRLIEERSETLTIVKTNSNLFPGLDNVSKINLWLKLARSMKKYDDSEKTKQRKSELINFLELTKGFCEIGKQFLRGI